MTPHRGLPPPAAMTLPSPTQQSSNSLGPQVPHQWQSSEEMSRTWMLAKMEEDRRKAEEERTKQEQLRMDTKRLELDFLREAYRMGIPPPVIPIMFAGGGALKGAGVEWLNEYYTQHMGHLQQQQQLVQQQQVQQQQVQQQPHQSHQMPPHHSPGPDRKLRREDRVIGPQSFGPPGQPTQPQHMGPPPGAAGMPTQQGPPPAGYMPPYPLSSIPAGSRSGPPAQHQTRPPQSQQLQVNTKDIHQAPILPGMPGQIVSTPISTPHGQSMQGVPPPPHPPPAQDPPSQPGIFFHHWVPPNSQPAGMATPVRATASPQRQLDSPFSHNPPPNQLTGPDYVSSPKKRKTTTTQSQQTASGPPFSPPFHPTTLPTATTPSRPRRGHSRHRSETTSSARGFEPYGRPSTRNRRSTGESPHPDSGVLGSQLPPVSSTSDNDGGGGGGGGGNGGPHHPREQEHQRQEQQRQEQERQDQQRQDQQRQDQQRQQSVPPPQQIGRPYSAGSDYRREPYPPQPPRSEGGGENRSKSGNGRD